MSAWLIKSVSLTSVEKQLYFRSQSFSTTTTTKKSTHQQLGGIWLYLSIIKNC